MSEPVPSKTSNDRSVKDPGVRSFVADRPAVVVAQGAVTDRQLDEILDGKQTASRNALIAELSARQILSNEQIGSLLTRLPEGRADCRMAREQLEALKVVRDGLRGPLFKLQRLLELRADWAAALVIQELQPWYCQNARQIILGSDRPKRMQSNLIKVVNAHSEELRLLDGLKRR